MKIHIYDISTKDSRNSTQPMYTLCGLWASDRFTHWAFYDPEGKNENIKCKKCKKALEKRK